MIASYLHLKNSGGFNGTQTCALCDASANALRFADPYYLTQFIIIIWAHPLWTLIGPRQRCLAMSQWLYCLTVD